MKSILITIAISVYMTFTVVTIQVANKQTLATSDVTLDIVEVMTRAFDEGEGSVINIDIEGAQSCTFKEDGVEFMRCVPCDLTCVFHYTGTTGQVIIVTCHDMTWEEELN